MATKPIQKPLESKVNTKQKDGKCYHKGFEGGFAQQLIQYACDVSNYDIDFVITLNAENGSRDYQKQSSVIKHGRREPSRGMCQMDWDYHKKTIYEGLALKDVFKSKYLNDRKYQIEECYRQYKGGTKMYGYNVRYKALKGLIFINGQKY